MGYIKRIFQHLAGVEKFDSPCTCPKFRFSNSTIYYKSCKVWDRNTIYVFYEAFTCTVYEFLARFIKCRVNFYKSHKMYKVRAKFVLNFCLPGEMNRRQYLLLSKGNQVAFVATMSCVFKARVGCTSSRNSIIIQRSKFIASYSLIQNL